MSVPRTSIVSVELINKEALELTKSRLTILDKLQKIRTPISFVLAQNDLVSSIKKIKETLSKSKLQNIHVSEIKDANHGMPYTQIDMLVKEILSLTKRFFNQKVVGKLKE